MLEQLGGPFATVYDVGGNVGDFAEEAVSAWPEAHVVSFEPVPVLAAANRERAAGRWQVEQLALSDRTGRATIMFCENQHSASTMQPLGPLRRELFKLRDRHLPLEIETARLDDWLDYEPERPLLVKVDVEGHEGLVLLGALRTLRLADTVVCEVQNDPGLFLGSASPHALDNWLRLRGLHFAGIAGAFCAPARTGGRVLQFDGIWQRHG